MDEMLLVLLVLIRAGSLIPIEISDIAFMNGFKTDQEQAWAFRQVWVESGFDPTAINEKTNCYGLMQINMDVWGHGRWTVDRKANLRKGFGYMRELKDKYGCHRKALAAYVWGPGNLDKHLEKHEDKWFKELPTEVANYVGAIAPEPERVHVWPLWAWWRNG